MAVKKQENHVGHTSADTLSTKLEAVLAQALKLHAIHNLPIIYRNQLCKQNNQFIHEYPNGKKYLIQQDKVEADSIVLQQL